LTVKRVDHEHEILILANDLEQTLARVFTTMEGIITHNPEFAWEAEVQARTIYLTNGTTATAISGDYAGAAGSNHGFVNYDELCGYVSEASTALWEELRRSRRGKTPSASESRAGASPKRKHRKRLTLLSP